MDNPDNSIRGSAQSPGAKQPGLNHSKLSELYSSLSEIPTGKNGQPKNGQKSAESFSPRAFAEVLLSKAPEEYLQQAPSSELLKLTEESLAFLDSLTFDSPENSSKVTIKFSKGETRVFVALVDCPFIVNTLTENALLVGGRIRLCLHPVLLWKGVQTSFTYLEIANLNHEQAQGLETKLREALSILSIITNDFAEMDSYAKQVAKQLQSTSDGNEPAQLLQWLCDEAFVFLGSTQWQVEGSTIKHQQRIARGLFRIQSALGQQVVDEAHSDVTQSLGQGNVHIMKLSIMSPVHRASRIVHVFIETSNQKEKSVFSFLGLLTSRALVREASSVPVVRTKLQSVLEKEDVRLNAHLHKSIVNIVDSMPKDEALILDVEQLSEEIKTILSEENSTESRVLIRFDRSGRNAWVLVALPRDRLQGEVRRRLQTRLENAFRATPGSSDYQFASINKRLNRIYFSVPVEKSALQDIDVSTLQAELAELTKSWKDLVQHLLHQRVPESAGALWYQYGDAFADDYQSRTTPEECFHDMMLIETLSPENSIRCEFSDGAQATRRSLTLSVVRLGSGFILSDVLPILESVGFEVIGEESSAVQPRSKPWISVHHLTVRLDENTSVPSESKMKQVARGVEDLLGGRAAADALNVLLINSKLDIQSIQMLRTYCNILWQMWKFISRQAMFEALVAQPKGSEALWDLFDLKFNPNRTKKAQDRVPEIEAAATRIREWLNSVKDITQDRVFKALLQLIESTVRTSFYKLADPVGYKIKSGNLDFLLGFRPIFEIFVSGTKVEGVHLRSATVARGGLRWSERPDDYRTEVLGLVKTQRVKNAIIVPSGAKGGFIVKRLPADRRKVPKAVQLAYEEYIQTLLSLTDNRVEGSIQHPADLIIYDEPDPYLVVAADKGTATFSDTANAIAVQKFDFWLGDAFASGGSQGYDHKRFGITARGAWEAVTHQMTMYNIDFDKEPITVVGIGDMSGDVFGNGLLLCKQMKLIAAFNHRHIFTDPTPDLKISFAERQRLFEQAGSQWTDYKPECISTGGGVYARNEKEVKITPELRQALSIPAEVPSKVSGEQLIQCILRADCTLLWNGGIGTYVKARTESDADADDSANDRVRINAEELRAKVVAEGGNLGFTQKARIEYAKHGGGINTDAIDNSGGVDLSDHEVNLKLLFQEMIRKNRMNLNERNALLEKIAPDVVKSVLRHNRSQAMCLTSAERRSQKKMEYFQALIQDLSKLGYLHRRLDSLPDDEELLERASRKEGLTRPELAVCLAAVKLWVKDELLKQPLRTDPLFEKYLLGYFPQGIVESSKEFILSHPLADNIIATEITNEIIEAVGVSYVHRVYATTGSRIIDVMRGLVIAYELLRMPHLLNELNAHESFAAHKPLNEVRYELSRSLREVATWLLAVHGPGLQAEQIFDSYALPLAHCCESAESILKGEMRSIYLERFDRYSQFQAPALPLRTAAASRMLTQLLEILWVAEKSGETPQVAGEVYSHVMDVTGLYELLKNENRLIASSKWEHELRLNSYEEIRRGASRLTVELLKAHIKSEPAIRKVLQQTYQYTTIQNSLPALRGDRPEIAALSVLAKQVRNFRVEP